MEGFQ